MIFLVALLLLQAPSPAAAETLRLGIAAAPEAVSSVPGMPGLSDGVRRFFGTEFGGSFPSLELDPEHADEQSAAPGDPSAQVLLGISGNAVSVSTDFARGGATRSLVSTVPTGSPASLVATIAGDLAYLYFSSRGFSTLPLSPAPALLASLPTDTLAALTGWNPEELEPVALASSGDEITICFPHRYLALGPLFHVSASTIRDINGQAVGREPMQLSGVVPGPHGRLFLLSEHDARIAIVDPRRGTRQEVDARGLSALPARLVGTGTLAALPGKLGASEMSLFPLDGGPLRAVPLAASYVPAFDVDREGNLWTWDAGERRVRILTPRGQELFAIRPLFSAALMQLPQRLAVLDDGSFLLAGSAEVWKFQGSGIPVWRLTRIPGRRSESLPSSFDLAANRSDGSFTILDAQSRRLLAFSSSAAGADGTPDSGIALLGAAGAEAERQNARIALLREKAAGYADFADGLTRDLLYERADAAWLRTAETLRELAAESPEDEAAAAMLQTALARRREVRAALAGPTEIQVVSTRVLIGRPDPCTMALTLEVTLRNTGAQTLRDVRVHAAVPTAVSTPALAAVDEMPPSGKRDVRIPLGLSFEESLSPVSTMLVHALVTYDRGREGISRSLTFSAQPVEQGPHPGRAESLACRVVTNDTLAASLSETLLNGVRPDPAQPLADLAGILASLGAARRQARTESVDPGPRSSMRNLLRGLASEESGWTVVTASIASTLGMPTAILCAGDRALALVDTGIPLASAQEAVPSLGRFREQLAALSAGGTLWLPLSGRLPSAGGDPSVRALFDGLEALAGQDPSSWSRAPIPPADGQQTVPLPFPLVLPVSAERPSIAALEDSAESMLAGAR